MIKVFFDGKCGLCSKEIAYYKRISPNGIFEWKDISESECAGELKNEGVTIVEGLKSLRAKDYGNKMHKGVDACILIWSQLKRWKILARLISLPIVKQCSELAYTSFARWRFSRLEHCQIAADNENTSK